MEKKKTLWSSIGYLGPCGPDGFPVPGELIRQHRLALNMTQKDLADKLDVSRSLVSRMETEDYTLNDINIRRKLLKAIPTLPFVGLGLVASATEVQAQPLQDVSLLQQLLKFHRETYFAGGNFGSIAEVEQTIQKIMDLSKAANHSDQQLLQVLCAYYQFGIDIAREERTYRIGNRFAVNAYTISKKLGPEFQASTLLRWSAMLFEAGDNVGAQAKIDEALSLSKLPAYLQGAVIIEALRPYALIDPKKAAQLVKKAYCLADSSPEGIERHFVRPTIAFVQMRHGFVLNAIQEPEKALDVLELAEAATGAQFARRQCCIQLFQAEALLQQMNYEQASIMTMDALNTSKRIKSLPNIVLARNIHTKLLATPAATSTEVRELSTAIAAR